MTIYIFRIFHREIQDGLKGLQKLIRAIELIEHHHECGRREYYQKKFYKIRFGTFLPYIFSRRLMVSGSGFRGMKGIKHRN